MIDKEIILKRIDELLSSNIDNNPSIKGPYVYSGTLSIVSNIYGPSSIQVQSLKDVYNRVSSSTAASQVMPNYLLQELTGLLKSYRYEVENDLIASIQDESKGEVFADFISFAKEALADGYKDVSAVLICAALEDSLKKYSESNGLDAEGKKMPAVVNLLKSEGLLKNPEAKILQSYVPLRNKAFHADWDKITEPQVSSVIGYLESFILTHFSG